MNTKWIERKNVTRTFQLGEEPELIHIIKTGFKDRYMVVFEDAFEHTFGKVNVCTKAEIESRYDIVL